MIIPAALQSLVNQLPEQPGVYQFFAANHQLLYVGKAKNLKRRVQSYFRHALTPRLHTMLAQVADIQITITRTEGEALLLEHDFIKAHQPRFNVLLRDDKSYPFIYLSSHQSFPRLSVHRGTRGTQGEYFGPYPHSQSVRATLQLLPTLFPVRQCHDTVFRHRSRPCLQYQLQRCSAPCVGFITAAEYAEQVNHTRQFLLGHGQSVISALTQQMHAAAAALAFEQAALLRDRVARLTQMQQRQYVTQGAGGDHFDCIAAIEMGGVYCVEVVMLRDGRNYGNSAYFPTVPAATPLPTVLAAFMTQFYAQRAAPIGLPPLLLVNQLPAERRLLQTALSERAGYAVQIRAPAQGDAGPWLNLAINNAQLAVRTQLTRQANYQQRLDALGLLLELPAPPARLECFDVSHTGGVNTVAACVVFNEHGPCPAEYRRFNIENVTPGDDYAALAQAVQRRYQHHPVPEVLLIDGGRGQLNTVAAVLQKLAVWPACFIAVAKGAERKVGAEQLWRWGNEQALITAPHSLALHLIQQVRDEAHRFAITGHRRRRAQRQLVLETIPGIGAQRRQQLLTAFGGWVGVRHASVIDLAQVPGIGMQLAERLYAALHANESLF